MAWLTGLRLYSPHILAKQARCGQPGRRPAGDRHHGIATHVFATHVFAAHVFAAHVIATLGQAGHSPRRLGAFPDALRFRKTMNLPGKR
jgi:hypothetical protein